MSRQYLEFEKAVGEAEEQLEREKARVAVGEAPNDKEFRKVERKLQKLYKSVYGSLSAHQRLMLARCADRPQTTDYVAYMLQDFMELHGDRKFRDDPAIVGGIGHLGDFPVIAVGHQRGNTTQERVKRNFGQASPEGNRKAQRLFRLAEKFGLPVLLFIDTQGAYPGLEAEERGQAQAIAESLSILASLQTRVLAVVIGEGGSGGALALGICDRLLMLENSVYSVISPEGCAAILWGKDDPAKALDYTRVAADSLKITARDLAGFGIVDEVISEPLGGAHHNQQETCEAVKRAVVKHLKELDKIPLDKLLVGRYEKFRSIGSAECVSR